MSRAEAIRRAAEKVIVTSGGFEILIRKPAVIDLVESGLGPVVAQLIPPKREEVAKLLGKQRKNGAKPEEATALEDLHPKIVAFCGRVMRDPMLHAGPAPVPEGCVTAEDLGDAVYEVFEMAMAFYGEGVKNVADAASAFRVDTGGEAGESSGATVPSAADATPETVTG